MFVVWLSCEGIVLSGRNDEFVGFFLVFVVC